MFYNDHPPPHFHVRYGEQRGLVEIESMSLLKGKLSPQILGLVADWAAAHADELWQNWNRTERQEPLERIAPLE